MEKPADSTLINVCVIPDDQVSQSCIDISQSVAGDTAMFVLGDGKFAHMTVYMARFADADIPKVVQSVSEALQDARSFRCEHNGYLITQGRYLEASYRKSDEFLALHEHLITHTADLRINPGHPFNEGYFAPYTPQQQKNAQDTGYDLARDLFRPHVTLTRYKEGMVPDAFPALPAARLSFELGKICVFKADDNGAVYELIREFHVD